MIRDIISNKGVPERKKQYSVQAFFAEPLLGTVLMQKGLKSQLFQRGEMWLKYSK